tara:strand:- start:436 stop:1011 length:576 start_codon:yes stop_codon:yes gene_type:complete
MQFGLVSLSLNSDITITGSRREKARATAASAIIHTEKIMNLLKLITLLTVFLSIQATALDFPKSGFTIPAFDGETSAAGSQPLTMMIPAVNGFSSNVNVQIQAYPSTIEDYKVLSEAQFKQMGIQALTSKIQGDSYFIEYEGVMNGHSLHFYSKAIKKGGLIYLATATALSTSWSSDKAQLIKVIDGFNLL